MHVSPHRLCRPPSRRGLPGLQQRLNQPSNAALLSKGRRRPSPQGDWAGSTFVKMVGAAGFEPALSRPQTERDTRLRYAPKSWSESTATQSVDGPSTPEELTGTVSRRCAP